MGEWVMSQLDARHGRGYSSVGSLNRLPARIAPDERDGTISLGLNHMLLPARSAAPATIAKADAVRVLLFDGDPIHREAVTGELSKQGFVVRSFGDSGALLGAVRDAVDVDVIVVLPKESSLDLLIKLQRQGVTVPVVFLGARSLPAQAVSKLQGLEGLAKRLRSVALKACGPTDQAPDEGPIICGRLHLRSSESPTASTTSSICWFRTWASTRLTARSTTGCTMWASSPEAGAMAIGGMCGP